ncbi:sodium:proton antiporter [Salinadaptatus halalkaliphilus]|uniref:Sodium:proton antiporter n=1 Tax=Salinadaptatus halalkaliphilus TaxID=2419781 RepID=A0A4S3TKP2_9EURY|nr:sodium:proton antiporter [Salinadaptatus halalkaliphilus]THE63148.1 sodium:proton antiporter [Salinadaptatus halalkaliphilus]
MKVPKLDVRYLVKSAGVVVLVIALLQYFGGILVETPGQIDFTGLATIGMMFLIFSAMIGIISANTSLPTPDWAVRSDQ